VRNYSSGMYVRLGFAVAVHLDPEIVLVDEALAVGDENFQRKCLRRLKEFQQRGVTIVLVSHDLALVEQFCERVCLLRQGTVETIGAPAEALARYHQLAASDEETPEAGRWGTRAVEILGVEFLSRSGESTGTVRTRDPLTIRLRYRAPQPVDRPVFGLAIHRDNGVHVTGPNTRMSGFEIESVAGAGVLDYEIARVPLLPGRYLISAAVYDHDLITPYDHRDRFRSLIVLEGGTDERFGTIELSGRWSFPETARAVRPSEAGTMVADA
jgi:lipopolysaccharide transport system ATP-binding protein